MSTMTMHPPYSSQDFPWMNGRSEPFHGTEGKVSLPSIRQAFPDFEQQLKQNVVVTTPYPATSPSRKSFNGAITPPEYIHSPVYHKRHFESVRDAGKTNSVPRLLTNLNGSSHRSVSPPFDSRTDMGAWGKSTRTCYPTGDSTSLQYPTKSGHYEQVEHQTTLSKLSTLNLARDRNDSFPGLPSDDYIRETHRRTRTPEDINTNTYGLEIRPASYRPTNYFHGYHHPNRVQSLSVGSAHLFDRPSIYSPAPATYGHQPHDSYMPVRELGVGGNYESKQRKRRGNLPKETTDKLRAWFHSHLSHPYPTEEEKQQLMKQTGLQLNQISNWFINARRRQLPSMINNARAEADAMTVRGAENNLIPSTERADYDTDGRLLSDEEAGATRDVEIECIKRRRVNGSKRGSI
ncbi:hypothetical protein F5Y00DRAFT_110676 [Daldinia vernicosa]|uniref:uncharacterized protein n=1 Tax=Daldinia vernicosa TaxID=114800 RepID=UPI0020078279|nr:uncharacterized protein F5Y00DRAFT_110676 [Daldinia vernicosa]KAI0847789.1 hypothetical protein F5Y00DRAFT_110676 [Daldinia vernicosa]